MFGTTTWPLPLTPAPAPPAGPGDASVAVRRIRVTRRLAQAHRRRRDTALPAARRPGTYVVRVHRPAGGARIPGVLILRAAVAAPHRARVAR